MHHFHPQIGTIQDVLPAIDDMTLCVQHTLVEVEAIQVKGHRAQPKVSLCWDETGHHADSKKAANVLMKPRLKCTRPTPLAWIIESATGVNLLVQVETTMGVFRCVKSNDSTSSCQ